jgi:regulator of sigma E protease
MEIGFLTIGLFIVSIATLIFIHELGHFIAARIFGIEVEEFGIGFPPRITTLFKFAGTEFTLNWIPLGGFVRPKGENDPAVQGGLAAAPAWKRIIVLVAGPLMNLATAVLFYSIAFSQMGLDTTQVEVYHVLENSPAEGAGVQIGDIIHTINGDMILGKRMMRNVVSSLGGQQIELGLVRGDELVVVQVTPRIEEGMNRATIGIIMTNPIGIELSPFRALQASGVAIVENTAFLLEMPGRMLSGESTVSDEGIVGLPNMFRIFDGLVKTNNSAYVIEFMAAISISLGLLNLLPLPALDGGRILFTLPELIIRRRVPPEYENAIHLIGFALLLILMIYFNIWDAFNPIDFPTPPNTPIP